MKSLHYSVMLKESLEALEIKSDGIYVDLTLGRAGHAQEILKQLTSGKLIAFDKDITALQESRAVLKKVGSNFELIHADFRNFALKLKELKISHVDGFIADLGFSSPQVDRSSRGFSYIKDGPLDMRMDQSQSFDADYLVNNYSQNDIAFLLRNNADVKLAQQVAKGIVANRPIHSTLELVDVIKKSLPQKILRAKNPAKAVFQALRIAVNDEFTALSDMLSSTLEFLQKDSRVVMITFHSKEDKIVNKFFGSLIKDKTGKLPVIVVKKYQAYSQKPTQEELNENSRSKSAKLRVLKKL